MNEQPMNETTDDNFSVETARFLVFHKPAPEIPVKRVFRVKMSNDDMSITANLTKPEIDKLILEIFSNMTDSEIIDLCGKALLTKKRK